MDRASSRAQTLALTWPWAQVATPEDPATARAGETVYEFVPRSWAGNLVDGYHAEARRLRAKGLPLLSLENRYGCGCSRRIS